MARRRAPGRTARPSRGLTTRTATAAEPWPNLQDLLDEGGTLTIGQIAPIPCAAIAADQHTMLVALVRQPNESLAKLMTRLDLALGETNATGETIDHLNT